VVFSRRKFDGDNLSGSLKWLRDSIASRLNLDDGDERIEWIYSQVQSNIKQGVLVLCEAKIY
jgi:hypothetical protein